ncbi:COPII-coated vesicle protein [Helicostylum pulchrum]|uniref:GOLD domain-containing protein n=1 Tax=Helicostylum pulchrum TaxID=562976 RepID=A0ABP9Y7K3_9FUNG|nr:COPII-coated vesicle protein [Helicostylum pulchrum]
MASRQVFLLLLVAVSFLLKIAVAMSIDIPARQNECFYEDLGTGDKLTLTFYVGDGENTPIEVWITNPNGNIVASAPRDHKGLLIETAKEFGKYTYCFSNKLSSNNVKSVHFNSNVNLKNAVDENNQEDPLKNEIEELAESILSVKAQQEYLVAREKVHRNTAESTNSRVKWWSGFQLVLLISVCLWQVHYLKHFFEVKRAV